MVFHSMSKHCSNAVKSRPPLVVFTACLLGIIVTTSCLAYYVHTHEKILNTDAKDDWISLLMHFGKFDICIENASSALFRHSSEQVRVATPVTMPGLGGGQPLRVQGYLPLKGWTSNCLEAEVPEKLQIEFRLDNNTEEQVCVVLMGSAKFMPKVLEQDSCNSTVKSKDVKWGRLTIKTEENAKDFCANGFATKLHYDMDYNKNLKFDMYLSQEDRLRINLHLIVTSSFLVAIVVLITCYTCIKSRNSNISDTKQHLMAKGMYL